MFTNVHPIPQEAHIVVNYARCAFGLKLFATRYNNVVQIVLKCSEINQILFSSRSRCLKKFKSKFIRPSLVKGQDTTVRTPNFVLR